MSVFLMHSFPTVPVPQFSGLKSCKECLCNSSNVVWDGRTLCSLMGEVRWRRTWLRTGATWIQINAPNEIIETNSAKCERNVLMWTGLSWHRTEPTRMKLINQVFILLNLVSPDLQKWRQILYSHSETSIGFQDVSASLTCKTHILLWLCRTHALTFLRSLIIISCCGYYLQFRKIRFFIWLNKHHAINRYGGVEV
jgi:hypothetical protein